MADESTQFIAAAVPVAVVAVLSFLMGSRRDEAASSSEGAVVGYGLAWKAVVGLLSGFPVFIVVLAYFNPPKDPAEWWLPYAIVGGFGAIIIPLWLEIFRRRVILGPGGITSHSPWTPLVTIAWGDVQQVTGNPSMQWWVIRDRRGQVIRVSMYSSGVRTLAQRMNETAPPEVSLAAMGIPSRASPTVAHTA